MPEVVLGGTIGFVPATASLGGSRLWEAVDSLIDRAPSLDDLRSHRLEVLAAQRFRKLGRPVPEDFVAEVRFAAIAGLTAPLVIERVRAVYDGPLMVFKGPEVAAHYPDPALRGYGDIDLLVEDAEELHEMLLRVGFDLVGDPRLYVNIHHLRPLLADGLPLPIEVHSRPKWLEPLAPPATESLFRSARGSATGVDGVFAPSPAAHAVVLAVHSWAHEPLRRLRDIIDIAAVATAAQPAEVDALAEAWGVERIWRTTTAAIDALLADQATPWTLRTWARNLVRARERTVLESHLQRCLSDFSAMPPLVAARSLPRTFAQAIGPERGERWREKFARTALAVRHASRGRSQHDRELDERARRSG
jgi:hypothetical protein